jgi:hypothetical protein
VTISRETQPSSLSLETIKLDWQAGKLPDTLEAVVPAGCEPFEVASWLRTVDPTAAYACVERDGAWSVVCMPDEPEVPKPAQSSEPVVTVWRMKVNVRARAANMLRAELVVFGPSVKYLESMGRRIANIASDVLSIIHEPVKPVDFGDDRDPSAAVNGLHPSWVDDGSNELAVVEAIGGIINYVRRVYPRNVPDNATLARQIAAVFVDLQV